MINQSAKTVLPSQLVDILSQVAFQGRINIAYSGGLDSRFLAFAAIKLGFDVRLFTVTGPHIDPEDTKEALAYAQDWELSVKQIAFNPLGDSSILGAGKQRCYVCKTKMFSGMLKFVQPEILCDGTNASDCGVYRPGRQALVELGVCSPLLQAQIDKTSIVRLAKKLGMPNPNQAARPCLLTRFPYGTRLSPQQLQIVAQAESFVRQSSWGAGLRFRLRFPNAQGPVLHWDEASPRALSAIEAQQLQAELLKAFPKELRGLQVQAVKKLSGFYDVM